MVILHIRSGTNQNDASRYGIKIMYKEEKEEKEIKEIKEKTDNTYNKRETKLGQPNEQPNGQPNEQPNAQASEHIITKLNVLFNYIINNNSSTKKLEIPLEDKKNLIMQLKRLDLFIDNVKVLEYFPEDKILEYKLLYWVIKELYFSPYKIFLNSLTRDQMYFRYYKAKKYMDLNNCSIDEFTAYFMRCVQEEIEMGNCIADRKSKRDGGEIEC